VRNNEVGIAAIVAALGQRGVGRVALEAIGGYARKLTAALIEAGVTVFTVNPRRIKAFRDAEGLIAKTDRLDAGLIARFAHVMADELRPLRDAGQAGLKALSTRRRQLTESIAIEKTRLKQAFDPLILDSCREMIALLDYRRRTIEAELDRRIEAEDRMARRRAILSSMPGIAARISTLVVIEMPELGEIGRKQAASLAGLAPIRRNRDFPSGATPSPGAVPACAPPSPWPPSSRCEAIPGSSRSISTCAPQENPQKSPSSPSPAEWSASQTPSSATTSLSIKQTSLDPPPNTVAKP
jgi:transposase